MRIDILGATLRGQGEDGSALRYKKKCVAGSRGAAALAMPQDGRPPRAAVTRGFLAVIYA